MLFINILLTIIMSSVSILYTLILVPFLLLGYTFYCINDINLITTISKNIKYSIVRDEQLEPSGFFIGKYYIGYIYPVSKETQTCLLYCLCTEKQFNILKKNKNIIIVPTDKFIDLYVRKGNYFCMEYKKRELNCTNFIAKPKQLAIIEQIVSYYKENNKCVTMISGIPGTGKTTIGILIAKELNGMLCKSYNPLTPGDNLENIYNESQPSFNKPLIILLDEFDIIIESIHNNKIIMHKNIPIEIYNKITWNNLFDDINLNLYPHLILILTTNLSKETLDSQYDSSYTRLGRVDIICSL